MVENSKLLMLLLTVIVSLLLPIIVILIARKFYRIQWVPLLVGVGVFILFAMILEQIMHVFVLSPTVDGETRIDSMPWIYVLYGVFAAGLFEETGRYLAFRLLKKKYSQNNLSTSIYYGIGHGGIEVYLILSLTMGSLLMTSLLINQGVNMPKDLVSTVQSLGDSSKNIFFIPTFERILALLLHISLSVIVWISVNQKKIALFFLAILLHAAADLTAVMGQVELISSLWIIYFGLIASLAITIVIAIILVKKYKKQLDINI